MDQKEVENIEKAIEKYTKVDVSTLSTKTMKDVVPAAASTAVAPAQVEGQDTTEYAKNNMKGMIEAGKKTLDGLFQVADQMQHPKVYESLTELLRVMTEMNREIVEMDKTIKSSRAPNNPDGGKVTNNNLIITTQELNKLLGDLRTVPVEVGDDE